MRIYTITTGRVLRCRIRMGRGPQGRRRGARRESWGMGATVKVYVGAQGGTESLLFDETSVFEYTRGPIQD